MSIGTEFGKGIIGFILKKFMEKKFGIEFEEFTVPELKIYTCASGRYYSFNIGMKGMISKGEVLKLVKGED
jgi:hypothetical protein